MTDCKNLDLARQWADGINAGVPVLAQVGHRAAAEVIRDLPDEWVDAEKLREVVADHHIDMSEELMEALGALLPAPTPPTLADMTPEERAECQWMQATFTDSHYEHVIASVSGRMARLLRREDGMMFEVHHEQVIPHPGLPRLVWPGNEPGNVQVNRMDGLARTGETSPAETSDNRRSSTARTHPESAALESAAPRPEDVPVGEPWQVEVNGKVAIGYRNDPDTRLCWAVVHRDDSGHHWLYDTDVTLIARLVPETTGQDDVPEFDPGYVYTDRDGDEWEYLDGRWITGDTHAERVTAREDSPGRASLPEAFGPYTRIEKENDHDQ